MPLGTDQAARRPGARRVVSTPSSARASHLKNNQTLLFGTRDKINLWMQDHPEDYR
ncbi:hypothetical protein [Streptomyces sp. NPDC089799]|uniref:hypothetical protein n=1 Tax=Streptomyces sp. NPDC089799 TaxID=3155066 RepID=UPI0034371E94